MLSSELRYFITFILRCATFFFRKHLLQFAEGTLEKHYEKLLQCDSRLYQLSRRPFSNTSSPFFDIIPVKQQANQYYSQSGIVFQPQQFLHQIPDVGTLCNINTPSQHFTPYQSISSSINSINSFYSFPLQTTTSSGIFFEFMTGYDLS